MLCGTRKNALILQDYQSVSVVFATDDLVNLSFSYVLQLTYSQDIEDLLVVKKFISDLETFVPSSRGWRVVADSPSIRLQLGQSHVGDLLVVAMYMNFIVSVYTRTR